LAKGKCAEEGKVGGTPLPWLAALLPPGKPCFMAGRTVAGQGSVKSC